MSQYLRLREVNNHTINIALTCNTLEVLQELAEGPEQVDRTATMYLLVRILVHSGVVLDMTPVINAIHDNSRGRITKSDVARVIAEIRDSFGE